jgi:ABC-type spermidine/putrescine transport system permease subunit I
VDAEGVATHRPGAPSRRPGGAAITAASPARFWRSREGALVLPALLFYSLVYEYPLSRIAGWSVFDQGFTLKYYAEVLAEPAYFKALRNTLEISVLVTLISLALGYPLAYLMATTSPRARRALTVMILIPFWTSILVRTFAWLVILGRNGHVNHALIDLGVIDAPQQLLFNMFGVQVGMAQVLLPFMVFPLYAVMSRIDPNVTRVARSLGAPPRKVFLHVFLPLSLPGVAAGSSLVFLLAVGFYVTPALLGGPGQTTFATMIDMMISTFLNFGFAATLGVLLLVVVAAIFVLVSALMGVHRIVGGGAAP